MSLFNWEKFIESQLTISDLKKPSDPKVTNFGPLRGDVLLGKINSGDEIEIKGGEKVKVALDKGVDIQDDDGNFDPEKTDNLKISKTRLKPVFVDKENPENKYKISDFVKTTEFSGGGGSSLGSFATRVMESLQTYVLSLKQNYYQDKFLHQTFLTQERNIQRMINSKDAFVPVNLLKEDLQNYKRYHLTFIKTANKFIGHNAILSPNKKYNFHQVSSDSEFMKQLHSTYRRCCIESFGKVVNMAKWTPSDIWAVNKKIETKLIKDLSKISRMDELNNFIDDNFGDDIDSRDIVGISLKKIASRKENITVVINKETERPRFYLKGVKISPNPFTKGLTILIDRESSKYPGSDFLSIRSSQTSLSNISAEIMGSTSRHGKCSFSQINDILLDNGMDSIPTFREIIESNEKSEIIDKIRNLDSKLKGIDMTSISSGSISKEEDNIRNLISKYQSLLFAEVLLKSKISGSSDCDDVINSIMYYALSISNKYFECPKYARIVEY